MGACTETAEFYFGSKSCCHHRSRGRWVGDAVSQSWIVRVRWWIRP